MGRRTSNQEWKKVLRRELADLKELGEQMLNDKVDLGVLSDKEESFAKQTVDFRVAPSPQTDDQRQQESRLRRTFSCQTSSLAFPNWRLTTWDQKNARWEWSRLHVKTTIQASGLKENLENQGITCNNSTTVQTHAEEFHPSARLKLVKKTVCHSSEHLTEENQINIQHCLGPIKFRMWSTLLAVMDKCHNHDGDRDPEEKGMTIGGCESAWLADLATACIPDKTKSNFGKPIVTAHDEKMEQQCSTTNFLTMSCSSWEPNSKTQQTD